MSGPGMKFAGIVGWPVRQSLSPLLHAYWLRENSIAGTYVPLAVRPEDLQAEVKSLPSKGFAGVNVTVPHKEAAFALADVKDDDALTTGAVNLLIFVDGKIHGRNTDVLGFITSLKVALGGEIAKRGPAVVLGAGGAARAVVLALLRAGAPEVRIVNRTRERAEALAKQFAGKGNIKVFAWGAWAEAFADASLLVNSTSLGMQGKGALDAPLDALPKTAGVADIVYNPLETDLLKRARARGHKTADGLGMLIYQAIPAFAAWFGVTPRVTPALRATLEEALRRA
jgi:shikimate dehydrogenase